MRYASFVIRLWLPASRIDSDPIELRGSIEHIQSGRVRQITDPEKIGPTLLELLESNGETKEAKIPVSAATLGLERRSSMESNTHRTHRLAIISLTMGIISALPFCFNFLLILGADMGNVTPDSVNNIFPIIAALSCLSVIAPPIALITGIMARKQIRGMPDTQKSARLATAGMVLGVIFSAIAVCIVITAISRLLA